MAEERNTNDVGLDTKTVVELSEQDIAFTKRFNLKPEDMQYKELAHLETENQ